MKHIMLIFAILFPMVGCAGIAEMEAPVEDASKARTNIPDPHLSQLTKAGEAGIVIPESLSTDPEFILLSLADWEEGHPVLRIDQTMALQMGIDSLSYQSFVNQLQL